MMATLRRWRSLAAVAVTASISMPAMAQSGVGENYRWVTFVVFAAVIAMTMVVTYLAAKRVRSAADFYGKLGKLLEGQDDRRLLWGAVTFAAPVLAKVREIFELRKARVGKREFAAESLHAFPMAGDEPGLEFLAPEDRVDFADFADLLEDSVAEFRGAVDFQVQEFWHVIHHVCLGC